MNKSRQSFPTKLYTAQQCRDLDRIAMQDYSMGDGLLMERAGLAAFQLLREHWPNSKTLLCVCGPGNNGGDGFVVARLAKQAGMTPTIMLIGDQKKLKGDAAGAANALGQAGINIHQYGDKLFQDQDVVLDGLFGTGLDRPVQGLAQQVIGQINQHKEVMALDIPSGLHADTGGILGEAVHAKLTLTFIGLKQGLLTGLGPDHCGDLYFNDLGVPEGVYQRVPCEAKRLQARDLQQLPRRRKGSHKGEHGRVLIIGGNTGLSGAVLLAGRAALRSGAGLVSIACHPSYAPVLNVNQAELMVNGIQDPAELRDLLDRCDVALLGPGLGHDAWAKSVFQAAITHANTQVIDADGLNLLAGEKTRGDWCLTPHPGEAARLLQNQIQDIERDRFAAVKNIQGRRGGVCVLKGAGSLIYDKALGMHLCTDGNPGMASGGMGDVLAGIIVGLLAQGLSKPVAVRLGVLLHALCGDRAAAAQGTVGLLASDLINHIQGFIND